uniref:Putative RuBisCO transcriptional regulator n=1 Tax=Cladosiphon okamuranus TaxID=309737 RepID=A0A6B7EV91_9PHAE|nr:putative RuBisCO transcriptional regulator [Cladosiphon okamuranus]QAY81070.1 putative RuBisCO transcriptional regulator [Cladosiphon okamuranus]
MKYFPFSLKQLKVLQAIKNEGNINIKIASKNLYLSQPTLSSKIKIFQHNPYSKILVRKKNQIYFTSEGELVLDYANKILKLCKEADNAIAFFKKLKRFRLKIGSNKTIGKNILLKLINLFCKRYPYAHVQLQIGCTKSLSWDLVNGKIDIGIVQEEEVPKNLYYSLYFTPYFEEKLVLIIAKFQKQKYKNRMNSENLYQLNFITLKPGFQERKFMDTNLKNFNVNLKELNIILELNSTQAIENAVRAGFGVSFLPSMVVKHNIYSKQLQSLLIDGLNNSKKFLLGVNLKKNESYLCERFYNYCFIILKLNIYNKFLNLS